MLLLRTEIILCIFRQCIHLVLSLKALNDNFSVNESPLTNILLHLALNSTQEYSLRHACQIQGDTPLMRELRLQGQHLSDFQGWKVDKISGGELVPARKLFDVTVSIVLVCYSDEYILIDEA